MNGTTESGAGVSSAGASTPPVFEAADASAGLAQEMRMLQALADAQPGEGHPKAAAFLWRAQTKGLVLPARFTRAPEFARAAAASAARGWPVSPRATGGGLTPQGPGVVNLALAFVLPQAASRDIPGSYDALCDPIRAALADLGIDSRTGAVNSSFCDGDYNLAVAGRKIVGTAQRWRRRAVLCHALILVDLDVAPAVSAIQALGDDLGQEIRYRPEAHTTLQAESQGAADTNALAAALWRHLKPRGFVPWLSG